MYYVTVFDGSGEIIAEWEMDDKPTSAEEKSMTPPGGYIDISRRSSEPDIDDHERASKFDWNDDLDIDYEPTENGEQRAGKWCLDDDLDIDYEPTENEEE